MGNQFIQMIEGKQVLVSFVGTFRRPFIHGEVIYSDEATDMYLVRSDIGNGDFQLYHCPAGDYARPQSDESTAKWVGYYEFDAVVAA